jgi:hypothetical protein
MKEATNEAALAGLYRVHGVLDFIRQWFKGRASLPNISRLALTVARSRMSSASAASLRSFSMYDL